SVNAPFSSATKPERQTHLYFRGEEMGGWAVAESISLIDCPKIKGPGREDIGGGGRRETRARKSSGRAVSTGNIITRDNDIFRSCGLSVDSGSRSKIGKQSQS